MKKYFSLLFILAIACAFSISAVAATDYETQDFDGKFKMDVEKGCKFTTGEEKGAKMFMDLDKDISVVYMENSVIKKDINEIYFDMFKATSGFKDDSTDGDIRIFKNDDSLYAAMVLDDGIAVSAVHKDKNEAVKMAKSVKFT